MTRHLIVLGGVAFISAAVPAVLLFIVEGWVLGFSGIFLFFAVFAIAVVLSDAYKRGSRIQTRPLLREWAKPHGWGYDPSPPIEDDSPLGYPIGIANAFWGRVLGSPGMIYELPHPSDEQGASDLRGYVVVRLELMVSGIAAIRLRYRVHGDKPLMDSTYREIELESVEFNRMFRLEAGPAVSEVELRRLFDPKTITFFLQSGADRLPPGFRLALENGVFFYITRGWVRPDTLAEIEKMLTQIEPFVRHLQALASARALS